MNNSFREFDARIMAVGQKHQKLSQGFRNEIDANGLIVQKPKGRGARGLLRFLPLRSMILLAGMGLIYKAFLLTQLGGDSYAQTVTDLSQGDMVERVGGWLMQADPVTTQIAQWIGPWVG